MVYRGLDTSSQCNQGIAKNDIIDMVLEDHRAVEQVFDKLQASREARTQMMIFAQVKEGQWLSLSPPHIMSA